MNSRAVSSTGRSRMLCSCALKERPTERERSGWSRANRWRQVMAKTCTGKYSRSKPTKYRTRTRSCELPSLRRMARDRSENTEQNEGKIRKDLATIEAVGVSERQCKQNHDRSSDCDEMETVATESPPLKSADGEDGKETDSDVLAVVFACRDGIPEIRTRDERARQDRKPPDIREPE